MVVFARWARSLFVACVVLLTGGEIFIDLPVLQVPVDQFIDSLLGVFAGGIIVFAFWSKVSDAFDKKAT
jgi:hypothetical protein